MTSFFISAVSDEFKSYRSLLAKDLGVGGFKATVQEDLAEGGGDLLEKLDNYIATSSAVIHLIGDMTGSSPTKNEVQRLLSRRTEQLFQGFPALEEDPNIFDTFSYTQWEALLALAHNRPCFIYEPANSETPRDKEFSTNASQKLAQANHCLRLKNIGRWGTKFSDQQELCRLVLRTLHREQIIPTTQPPFQAREFTPIDQKFHGFRHEHQDVREVFLPSYEELAEDKVYEPKRLEIVRERLQRDRLVWLRGTSGSGKSIIAMQLAVEAASSEDVPLYLDLREEDYDHEGACDDISAAGNAQQLFVIDNIHENAKAAAKLLTHWQKNGGNRTRIILLGWPAEQKERPLVAWRPHILEVIPEAEDLAGLFKTLHSRFFQREQPPEVDATIRQLWLTNFGADYVAFQYALVQKMITPGTAPHNLDKRAAHQRVRDLFFSASVPNAEQADAKKLAVFSELGLNAPAQCIQSAFTTLMNTGLIVVTEHGHYKQHRNFRFWHESLGPLLLTVCARDVDKRQIYLDASTQSPFFGTAIGRKLWSLGSAANLAREVIKSSIASSRGVVAIFGDNLRIAQHQIELIIETGVLTKDDLCNRLKIEAEKDDYENTLLETALATPLHFLKIFLEFAEKEMRGVFTPLASALAREANKPVGDNKLLETALATPLHFLTNFLKFAKKNMNTVFTPLVSALAQEATLPQNRLLLSARKASPDNLTHFLEFAQNTTELNGVFTPLVTGLAQDADKLLGFTLEALPKGLTNFLTFTKRTPRLEGVFRQLATALREEITDADESKRLLFSTLVTSPDKLANFLEFAEKTQELAGVFKQLVATALEEEAAKPEGNNRLRDTLLDSLANSPEQLVKFLRYAQEDMPNVFELLSHQLECVAAESGPGKNRLLQKMIKTPYNKLNPLLTMLSDKTAYMVLSHKTADNWLQAFENLPKDGRATDFGRFAVFLEKNNRPDIAAIIAKKLIQNQQPCDWSHAATSLFDISKTLQLAAPPLQCSSTEINSFLEEVVTDDWLSRRYDANNRSQTAVSLSNGLFHLLINHEKEIIEHFVHPTLATRASIELNKALRGATPEESAAILQFWAAVWFAKCSVYVNVDNLPSSGLATILVTETWPHSPEIEEIEFIQQKLWFGLMIFAQYHPEPVTVPKAIVEKTLARWKKTAEDTENRTPWQQSWDPPMIRWLQNCADNNGVLQKVR